MKKIILLIGLIVMISGCVKVDDSFDSLDETKPQTNESTTAVVTDSNDNTTETVDSELEDENVVVIEDTTMSATFEENVASNPSTITFNEDNTLTTYLNLCSLFENVEGTYEKNGSKVTLRFENTGYDFLDATDYTFELNKNTLTLEKGQMFSCAGSEVETYELRK